MKKILCMLLTVCILFAVNIPALAAEAMPANGTTPTSLSRGGKVACDGQTVYFACGGSVYATPLAGGAANKLFDAGLLGDTLYRDGETVVSYSCLNVLGGSLYFGYEGAAVDYVGRNPASGVYRFDLASGTGMRLAGGSVSYLSVENGIITYALFNDYMQYQFYQMNTDGSNNHATGAVVGEAVSGGLSGQVWSFFVADGWIYYERLPNWDWGDDVNSNRLYRMRINGSENMQVNAGFVDDISKNFSVYQGRLYFNQGAPYTATIDGRANDFQNWRAAFCTSLPDGSDKREINMGEGHIGPDGKRWERGKVNFNIWEGKLYQPRSMNSDAGAIGVDVCSLDGTGARVLFETDYSHMTDVNTVYPVPGWLFLDVNISDQWSTGINGDPYRFGIYRMSPEGGEPELLAAYSTPAIN